MSKFFYCEIFDSDSLKVNNENIGAPLESSSTAYKSMDL